MRKFFMGGCIALFCAVGLANSAHACSCLPQKPLEQALADNDYDAIFVGEVMSIEEDETRLRDKTIPRFRIFTLKVKEAYKGVLGETARIVTPAGEPSCGYGFEKSNEYMIFAKEYGMRTYKDGTTVEAPYRVSLCSHTKPITDAGMFIKLLEEEGYGNQYRK